MIIKAATLLAATPVAVNALIVSRGMGLDVDYAVDSVVASTAVSMITTTCWLFVLGV